MLDAYSALKNKIATGKYIVSELKNKINTIWVEGDLSDEEKLELTNFAESNVDPNYSSYTKTELELLSRIAALEARLVSPTE